MELHLRQGVSLEKAREQVIFWENEWKKIGNMGGFEEHLKLELETIKADREYKKHHIAVPPSEIENYIYAEEKKRTGGKVGPEKEEDGE